MLASNAAELLGAHCARAAAGTAPRTRAVHLVERGHKGLGRSIERPYVGTHCGRRVFVAVEHADRPGGETTKLFSRNGRRDCSSFFADLDGEAETIPALTGQLALRSGL